MSKLGQWTLKGFSRSSQHKSLLSLLQAGGQAAEALTRASREVYLRHGFVHLPLFCSSEAVAAMAKEALGCQDTFYSTDSHNPYLKDEDPKLASTHPRNVQVSSSKTIVNYSQLGADSPLKALYGSAALLGLIRAIVSPERDLFTSRCPISSAYYNIFREGDGLGWHFDNSEFGVNLVLKSAEGGDDPTGAGRSGGEFEFDLNTRSAADPEAYAAVEGLLASGCPSCADSVQLASDLAPGSLVVFSGHNSLHRVTPVLAGASPRVNVIFTFEAEEGAMANDYVLRKFFGRTVEDQRRALTGLDSSIAFAGNVQ